MQFSVKTISSEGQLQQSFHIRKLVFVHEQLVNEDEEFDEFEDECTHLLAVDEQSNGVGTCRWRFTPKGIKLERFAVLKEFRGMGLGYLLVKSCLESIRQHPEASGKLRYMHAQLEAIPLYEKFGFKKEGPMFDECGIWHYTMNLEDS
jgi:predicted GNAT family N-acyltransferase